MKTLETPANIEHTSYTVLHSIADHTTRMYVYDSVIINTVRQTEDTQTDAAENIQRSSLRYDAG